jgi:hypothetical protein
MKLVGFVLNVFSKFSEEFCRVECPDCDGGSDPIPPPPPTPTPPPPPTPTPPPPTVDDIITPPPGNDCPPTGCPPPGNCPCVCFPCVSSIQLLVNLNSFKLQFNRLDLVAMPAMRQQLPMQRQQPATAAAKTMVKCQRHSNQT